MPIKLCWHQITSTPFTQWPENCKYLSQVFQSAFVSICNFSFKEYQCFTRLNLSSSKFNLIFKLIATALCFKASLPALTGQNQSHQHFIGELTRRCKAVWETLQRFLWKTKSLLSSAVIRSKLLSRCAVLEPLALLSVWKMHLCLEGNILILL